VIPSIAGDESDGARATHYRVCAPYVINSQNIIIGASMGIAMIDHKCGTATDIMRYADMALYRAKNEGRNRACIYDAAMDADLSSRKLLEADLREAIDNDRLRLVYQPVVNKAAKRHRRRGSLPLDTPNPRRDPPGVAIAEQPD
jgi:predicted signal transduction protein with EAL and GGDEF domain